MSDLPGSAEDVLVREEGRAGFLTLNRPGAMNALTPGMIATLEASYIKWASAAKVYGIVLEAAPGRAFCGGGDIRSLVTLGQDNPEGALQFFRDEYQHNWTLQSFIKPSVALIDGIVMGGGVGISLYGTHRVAGENLVFAMPETGIGFFPDIGGGYFLPRFPGETGMYLGLTGNSVKRADAYYLGVATHCIDAGKFDVIRAAMIEGDPIDAVLDGLHQDPGESELKALRPVIDRIFSAESVEAILAGLDAETGAHADWAQRTASTIRQQAPLSLKVACRQIREGARRPTLKDELKVEFRLAARLALGFNLREGVRALLVDKDRSPKWQPASLEDVTHAMVEDCFAPLGGEELILADRWTLVD
jgi:enoyl-CoA hydratase